MIQILTNHLGYLSGDYKKAVLQGEQGMSVDAFRLIDSQGKCVFQGTAQECGTVAEWKTGYYWTLSFSEFQEPGTYILKADTSEGCVSSYPFEITEFLQDLRMLNAVSYYFKAQRSTGEWAEKDSALPFEGEREGMVDAHGGWLDATGDYGIHMSHLSHSTVCNPQQVPFSAYVFFKAVEHLQKNMPQSTLLIRRMLDEGSFGADFIMRMRAPSGSFFRSINRTDSFGSARNTREIGLEYRRSSSQFSEKAATADEETVTDANYETSFRSGGGLCIAALAAAARHFYPGTDYNGGEYLLAAKDAFAWLWEHNESYCNDGEWNLLDEYCALLAAAELYRSSSEYVYLCRARELAERMLGRMEKTGDDTVWFYSRPGEPFCHAAEEGIPVVALLTFLEMEPDAENRKRTLGAVEKAMRHMLAITKKVINPFGYARYFHRCPDGGTKEKFFYFHDNPAAPWWQGDNARLASCACAAWMTAAVTKDMELAEELKAFAQDQINWVMGLNPFDACMIEGYGRNNISYFFNGRYDFLNCPGGICNGITSRPDNEEGIFFLREPAEEIYDNWRWAEQWIPHNSWFIYALAVKKG